MRAHHLRVATGLLAMVAGFPVVTAGQAPVQVRMKGVEITQGIQNLANDVPTIAGRVAVVRLYLEAAGQASHTVGGTLMVSAPGVTEPQVVDAANDAITVPPAGTVSLTQQRHDLTRSLNFVIPPAMMRGTEITLDFALTSGGQAVTCLDCDTPPRPLMDVPPLRINAVRMTYQVGAQVRRPREVDLERIKEWLLSAFPVPDVEIISSEQPIDLAPPFDSFACQFSLLLAIEARRTGDLRDTPSMTRYLGLVFGDNPESFARGCSRPAPTLNSGFSAVAPVGPVANFPKNDPDWAFLSWDDDVTYGDWYAGHELAHTFGRMHPGACRFEDAEPTDPDFDDDEKPRFLARSEAESDYIGLEIKPPDATGRLTAHVREGRKWADVMTYCGTVWMGAWTFKGLAQRLRDEQAFLSTALPQPIDILAGGIPPPLPQPASGPGPVHIVRASTAREVVMAAAGDAQDKEKKPAEPTLKALGIFDKEKMTAQVKYVIPLQTASQEPRRSAATLDPASLRLRVDTTPGAFVEYECELTRPTGAPEHLLLFECLFPQSGTSKRATLMHGPRTVGVLDSSRPAPDVRKIEAAPVAAGPGGGGVAPLMFTWDARVSPEGSYMVQVSRDKREWFTIGVGLKERRILVPAAYTKGQLELFVKVTAIDGAKTAEREHRIAIPPANR